MQDFDVLVMHSCDHDLCNEGVSKHRSGFGREKLAGLKFELSLFSEKRTNPHYKMSQFDKSRSKVAKNRGWIYISGGAVVKHLIESQPWIQGLGFGDEI